MRAFLTCSICLAAAAVALSFPSCNRAKNFNLRKPVTDLLPQGDSVSGDPQSESGEPSSANFALAPATVLALATRGGITWLALFARDSSGPRFSLQRRDANGAAEDVLALDGPIYALAIDANNQVYFGGRFSQVTHQQQTYPVRLLGRLHTSIDESFPGVPFEANSQDVRTLALDPQGGLHIGGQFQMAEYVNHVFIDLDGAPDPEYNDGATADPAPEAAPPPIPTVEPGPTDDASAEEPEQTAEPTATPTDSGDDEGEENENKEKEKKEKEEKEDKEKKDKDKRDKEK